MGPSATSSDLAAVGCFWTKRMTGVSNLRLRTIRETQSKKKQIISKIALDVVNLSSNKPGLMGKCKAIPVLVVFSQLISKI